MVDDETGRRKDTRTRTSFSAFSCHEIIRDVAGESEISAAYLQKLERGLVEEPSPRILRRLSEALRVDYGRLMQLAGYKIPGSRRPASPLTTRFADARLTEAEERAVAAFIDHLVQQREPE